jgi:hypothetical protein
MSADKTQEIINLAMADRRAYDAMARAKMKCALNFCPL